MADQPVLATPDGSTGTTPSLFDGLTTTKEPQQPQQAEVAPTASSSALDTLFKFWTSSVSEVEIAQYSDGPSEKYARVEEKDSATPSENATSGQPAGEAESQPTTAPVSATASSIFNFSFWASSASESKKEEETEKPAEIAATSNNTNDAQQPNAADAASAEALAKKKQLDAIPLDKFRISNDDVEYLKEHLTPTNMRLEVLPRWDGTGAQYTPLGWAIYTNARESITFFLTNNIAPIDPTSVVARSYMTILPDMLMKSAFVRRMAPSQIYEKTQYSCNALDLAVMLGRKEVLEEILNLAIAWNRKFHDPLGYALDLSKTFFGWTSGKLPIEEKDTPRKVSVSAEESKTYQAMIDILLQAGAGDIADDVWENSHWLLTVDTPHAEFTGSITEFKIPSNNNSATATPINSSAQLLSTTQPSKQSTEVSTASTTTATTTTNNNSNPTSATMAILPSLLATTRPVQSSPNSTAASNLLFQSSSPLATSPAPLSALPANANLLVQSTSPLSAMLFQSSSPLATSPSPISLPLDLNFASSPIPFSSAALSPTGPLSPVMSPRLPLQNASDPSLLFALSPRNQSVATSPSVLDLLNSPRAASTEPAPSLLSTVSLLDANLSPRGVGSSEIQLF